MKKRIAILTWHYHENFGSALQAYALQECIKEMGYNVKIINYRNLIYGKVNKFKNLSKIFINKILGKKNFLGRRLRTSYSYFHFKFFKQTKLIQDIRLLPSVCRHFYAVICGSDQIWAPNVFNPTYFLDFVDDGTKKLSYAASLGLNKIENNLVPEYKRLLSRFNAISVRENIGAKLLSNECNINADVVIDPTLLLDTDKWVRIENKPFLHHNDKFVFCYFLNDAHNYSESVKNFASDKRYKVIGVTKNTSDKKWMDIVLEDIGPQEFIWLIHNADVIFTDSYHGTIFSLLFHKDFITFERFANDDAICQNSRIHQLSDYFEIKDNIINVTKRTELKLTPVDYNKFENNLKKLRNHSLDFLNNSLEEL